MADNIPFYNGWGKAFSFASFETALNSGVHILRVAVEAGSPITSEQSGEWIFTLNTASKGSTNFGAPTSADVDANTTAMHVNLAGTNIVKQFSAASSDWQYATPIASPITNTSAVAIRAAQAAGIRNYVTGFYAYNNSATTSIITIQDGSTVIWTGFLAANSGLSVQFPTPLRGTAATAMNVVLNTTATSTFVSAQGYSAP